MASFTRWISGETTISPVVGPAYYNSALTTDGASERQNAKLTV